jgi:hypothetical protein
MSTDKPPTVYYLGIQDEPCTREQLLGFCNVGPGWQPLIDVILAVLDFHWLEVRITQVKEKFGGLRFYFHPVTEYPRPGYVERNIQDVVDTCEMLSFKICQPCGRPGERRKGGWTLTLCDECHEEREKERAIHR